jgi:hypothetical protein
MKNKFGLNDTNYDVARKRSDDCQFRGYKVKDFNEEELRVAIGLMAQMIVYEQNRIIRANAFNHLILSTVNYPLDFDSLDNFLEIS